MTLTGKEIRQYLEKSYDGWVTTMTSPDDHLICMNNRDASRDKFFGLKDLSTISTPLPASSTTWT